MQAFLEVRWQCWPKRHGGCVAPWASSLARQFAYKLTRSKLLPVAGDDHLIHNSAGQLFVLESTLLPATSLPSVFKPHRALQIPALRVATLRLRMAGLACVGLVMSAVHAADQPVVPPMAPPAAQAKFELRTERPKAHYAEREDAVAFAINWANANGVDPQQALAAIGGANKLDRVIKLVAPAPKTFKKDWRGYRARFIEPVRLKAGRAFWAANAQTLQRAQATYGVPAWLIVGVIGVESLYGQHKGDFATIDVLSTLAFDFPKTHPKWAARQAFFNDELAAFLQLAAADDRPIEQWVGSYAGALGWPQFMPSSWQKFAVDFDNDGHIDLLNSQADVIGSVANYFKVFGWQTGMPTHYPVKVDPNNPALAALLAPDIVPSFSASHLHRNGARLRQDGLAHQGKLALVLLENAKGKPTYVAGTHNFYVVTRYNWSSYYALAVIDLGQAVASSMQ